MKEEEPENLQETPTQPENESPAPQQENPKYKISIVEKWKEIMKAIKEKTGIDGLYVILFLLVCVILVYLGIFGDLITNMVGTLYPGFCTIKAMEKKQNKKEWLTYWVIFGTFIIVDTFSNIIMKIVPFYFVLKILFLIWMFLPGSNGCKLVYNFLIFNLFKSIENYVDTFMDDTKYIAKEIYKEGKSVGIDKMQKMGKRIKVIQGSLLKGKFDNMEEARKAAEEIENEENNNKKNVLRGKNLHKDENSGAVYGSVVPSFPNKMEKKFFKEELEEIKNPIPENKEELDNNENEKLEFSDVEDNKNNKNNTNNNIEKPKNEEKVEKPAEIKDEKLEKVENNQENVQNPEKKVEINNENKEEKTEEKIEDKKEEKTNERKEENQDEDSLDEKFSQVLQGVQDIKFEEKKDEPINEEKSNEKKEPQNNEIKEEEKNNEPEINFGDKLKDLESMLTFKPEQKPEEKKEEEKKEEEKKEEEKKDNLDVNEENKISNNNEEKLEEQKEESEQKKEEKKVEGTSIEEVKNENEEKKEENNNNENEKREEIKDN